MPTPNPSSPASNRRAFTLVELLVVIGIIALLISILLPSLNRARESANRVKCMSNLRQLGMAASMHATDTKGYVPLAGVARCPPSQVLKFASVDFLGTRRVAPWPVSLGRYLSLRFRDDSLSLLEAELRDPSRMQNFVCPSQGNVELSAAIFNDDGTGTSLYYGPSIYTSYGFNEQLCGINTVGSDIERLRPGGRITRVKHPTKVVLYMDALPKEPSGFMNYPGVYGYFKPTDTPPFDAANIGTLAETLMDVGNAVRTRVIDKTRHRNVTNILFLDGHVEPVPIGEMSFRQVHVDPFRQ